jgi:hypothetical protein
MTEVLYDDEELLRRAKRAYTRSADVPIPSAASEVTETADGEVLVRLCNVKGPLATYRDDPESDRLTPLPRPTDICDDFGVLLGQVEPTPDGQWLARLIIGPDQVIELGTFPTRNKAVRKIRISCED